jgi:uncharacterized protein YndB with AHSA1/START domain
VEIHAAPETVFAAMTDPDTVVKWVSGLVASEQLTDTGLVVGARSREVIRDGKREVVMLSTVTAVEPGRRLTMRLEGAGMTAETDFRLTPLGEGRTRVEHELRTSYSGILRWIEFLFRAAVQRKVEADLGRLREYLEA